MKIFRGIFYFLTFILIGTLSLEAQTYDNSASNTQTVPEVIWANATGGETWQTEIQVCNRLGPMNEIYVTFDYYGGGFRGPFLIHTFTGTADNVLGSAFTKTFSGFEFLSFNPLAEAGIPYPGTSTDQCFLLCTPQSGTGRLLAFGATSHNISNDPGAHIAVNYSVGAAPGQIKTNAEEVGRNRDR
jgi:hypothetical protein